MLRHPATITSLMQALRLRCIDTQSPAGGRLGCIDTQPPQPPEYWHMYSACASSDRLINQLTYNPFISLSLSWTFSCAQREYVVVSGPVPDCAAFWNENVSGIRVLKTAVLMHAVVADGGWPKESAENCQYNTGTLSSTSTQGLTHGGAADVALALRMHLSVDVLFM